MKSEYLKIGDTTFNVPTLTGWTKDRFLETYKDYRFDTNEAWDTLQNHLKELGLTVEKTEDVGVSRNKAKAKDA